MTVLLNEDDVRALLPMGEAIDECEAGFQRLGKGLAVNHPRRRIRTSNGTFQMMTAADLEQGIHGFKTYSSGGSMIVLLYESDTGALLAILQANALGQIRTGAASGLATKYMSRQNSTKVSVIGSGYQARTQLEAISCVRSIDYARVYSRNQGRRETFAREMSERLGFDIEPTDNPEDCVRDSDIVIAITNSQKPVLLGKWVTEGMHINAAGGNHWTRQELDETAVGKCSLIAVDDFEQARIECGDLLFAEASGDMRWEQVQTLSDIVANETLRSRGSQSITLFESQGVALEDITVAYHIYCRALQEGRVKTIDGLP